MKGVIMVNTEKCLACHSCRLGCAVEHSQTKELFAAISEKPRLESRVIIESFSDVNVPLQCRHCEDAPCVRVCPTKALTKGESQGAVLVNNDLCIGCKWCIVACPFGVITLSKESKGILKCDLCSENDNTSIPACVSSCPTKALEFTSLENLTKEKRREFLVDLLDK